MIIRKLNIISYGALRDKIIEFNDGVNIVYGQNEAGKSTIQSFIRVMLYGFSNSRAKDKKNNERLRFYPILGNDIRGELYVAFHNREYVIKRSFGKSKKDDESWVLDAITGEEIDYISKDEPGKYFLGVNRSTFCKTVFIEQLGVLVSKDKEEEIMEKAVNLLGAGEESISLQKIFDKLETNRKLLSNQRKTGKLDNLKRNLSSVYEEQHSAYRLSESNLENERGLIKCKEKRKYLNTEIRNLDIYKKYLKKIKLQKEYEDITTYLKKSEELKEQVKEIDNSLDKGNGVIDEVFLNDIREENSLYFSMLDLKNEEENRYNKFNEILEERTKQFSNLLFVEELELGSKESLIRDSIELKNLSEKKKEYESIKSEINDINNTYNKRKSSLGNGANLIDFREEIKNTLLEYEEVLRTLKDKMEKSYISGKKEVYIKSLNNKLFIVNLILGVLISLFLVLWMFNKVTLLIIIVGLLIMAFIVKVDIDLFIKKNEFNKMNKEFTEIDLLKNRINELENKLQYFKNKARISNDKDFLIMVRRLDDLESFRMEADEKLRKKEYQLQLYNIEEIDNNLNVILIRLDNIKKISSSDSIEEVISKISDYEKFNKDLIEVRVEISNSKEGIDRYLNEIKIREDRIRGKLKILGLQDIDLHKVEDRVMDLKEKLDKKHDLEKALNTIEETYKVLIKGKDIERIKEDLGGILTENIKYSYESEEEIDNQIRIKSKELIDVEKNIKDLEHSIAASFIGKRKIPTIEEDIANMVERIQSEEKKLKAIDLSIATFKESMEEMRSGFGPKINNKVLENFKNFTNNKYSEVLVSDKYEMLVRNDDGIFESALLSNGANDQLYLSLRMAFIDLIFKDNKILILDDAFMQYDDVRTERALEIIINNGYQQVFIFTCHNREMDILSKKYNDISYINL